MPNPGQPSPRYEAPNPGALVPPPQRTMLTSKSLRGGVGGGSARPHLPRPRKTGNKPSPFPKDGRLGEGECPTPDTCH